MEFVELNINNFPRFKSELELLYLSAFTKGEHAQYIPKQVVSDTLKGLIEIGFGYIAKSENKIAGMIFAHSLDKDSDFPDDKTYDIDPKKSMYIAEVLVDEQYRGRGIAKKLLEKTELKSRVDGYNTLMLRVWDENIGAISLYKNFGFKETGITISQIKFKNKRTSFEMKKLYLYKKLD